MSGSVENQRDNGFANETLSPEALLDFLEDRQYICPCCDEKFSDRRARMSKLKLLDSDSDLRPRYSPLDPILYDVVICKKCGYGSLAKTFDKLSFKNAQTIISSLPQRFKNVSYPMLYTEDVAIKRYHTALRNALLIHEKSGVIAYIYMRLAWIYRTKGDAEAERRMILAAFEGFLEATRKESFPILDLDEGTVYYIMGDFLVRLSKKEAAGHFFNKAFALEGTDSVIKKRISQHTFMNND